MFQIAQSLNIIGPTTSTSNGSNSVNSQNSNPQMLAMQNIQSFQQQLLAKTKNKKNIPKQERNIKTVISNSVAGYRGQEPVEELLKYIESSESENKMNSSKMNESNKKKERKNKEKDKQQKMKRCNSYEELRNVNKMYGLLTAGSGAATAESDANGNSNSRVSSDGNNGNSAGVLMRSKQGKKQNSASSMDINKNFEKSSDNKQSNTMCAAANGRKGERRSWGTEELQYLGDSSTAAANALEDSRKEKHSAKQQKQKDKDKEKPTEQEKTTDKRKKSESDKIDNVQDSALKDKTESIKVEPEPVGEPVTIVDILAIESLVPDTAVFHLVTKKRKPKKQRASLDETSSSSVSAQNTIHRSYQFITGATIQPKLIENTSASSTPSVSSRHKHSASQSSHQERSAQDYSGNSVNQQTNAASKKKGDKSRRKSTSSVPPSEKSDSSDLDSVHSLPIESSSSNASQGVSNNNTKSKQRLKGSNSTPSTSTTQSSKTSENKSSPAPISYADIAKANREKAAAAAAAALAADKWPSVEMSSGPTLSASHITVDHADEITHVTIHTNSVTATHTIKVKAKRSVSKPDFPELVSNSTAPSAEPKTNLTPLPIITNTVKPISYSQSLTTLPPAPVVQNATLSETPSSSSSQEAKENKLQSQTSHSQVSTNTKNEHVATNASPVTNANVHALSAGTPQQKTNQLKTQDQPITTGSNTADLGINLDQQYPALQKTVKRHNSVSNTSTTISQTSPAPLSSNPPAISSFNFAAAAKQQLPEVINNSKANISTSSNIESSQSSNNNNKKTAIAKDKTLPPVSFVGDAANSSIDRNNIGLASSKKSKKEKQTESAATQTVNTVVKKSSLATSAAVTIASKNSSQTVASKNKINATSHAVKGSFETHSIHQNQSIGSQQIQRPAVIILNDKRDAAASNEFTFGDFNEEELKFFDTEEEEKEQQKTKESKQKSPAKITTNNSCGQHQYLNDSGASSDVYLHNSSQPTDDMLTLMSQADASSSPNNSFNQNSTQLQTLHYNNQSSDSGIYNSSQTKTNSKEESLNNKLNKFISNTSGISSSSTNRNSTPPSQQLETCNDIETAILAAARAAANNGSNSMYSTSSSSSTANATNPKHLTFSSSNSSSFSSSSIDDGNSIVSNSNSSNGSNSRRNTTSMEAPGHLQIQHKEFDIHYKPPTKSTAISSLQHNEIIVDFIGSGE